MSKYQGPVFHKRLQTERIVHKPSPREVKRTQQPIANNDIPFYHKPDYQAASKPAAPAKKPEKQTVSAYEDRTSTPFKVSHVPPPLYGTRKKKTEPKEQIDYQLIFQKLAKTDEEFLLFEEYLSEFGEEVEKSSEEINLTFTIEEPEAEQMEVQEEQTVASVVEETIEEESVIVETEEALPQETVQSMSESIESAIEEPEVEHMEVQAEHAAPITEKTTEPAPVNVETEDNLPQEPVQSVNKAVESEAEEPTQPKEIKKRGLSRSLAGMIQEEQDARLNKGRNIARYFGESLKEVKSKEVKPKAVQDESQPATLSELLAQSRRNQPSSANQLENLLKANEEPYSRKSLQAEKAPEIAEEIQTESEPVKEVAEVPEIIEAVEPQEAVEEAEAVKVPEEEMIEAPQEANTDSTSVTSEQPATITELLARAQAGSTQDLEALIGEEEATAEDETAQEANHSVEEPIESDRKEVNEEFVDTEITENPAEPSEVIQIEPASEETVDAEEAPVTEKKVIQPYQFPSLDLLDDPVVFETNAIDDWVLDQAEALNETLEAFNVEAQVVGWTIGPAITQFELQLGRGVKVNKITNLADDLKLSLAAKDIRIEAPIPGKSTVGVEVPNKKSRPVMISEVIGSEEFENSTSPLTIALGVNLAGKKVVTTIDKMPHGLIAGATGSGKSVFINSLLVSLLYKATPNEVKLILIDPKAVELAPYNGLPHLLSPVISEPKAANEALKWAVNEMEERYQKLAAAGVRNLEGFNKKAEARGDYALKLPYIVIIIDELADLMMVASNEVQDSIARITQKARAAGIHLIVATQRPSVDVVTGTIKNNIPTRVAFMVSSQIDSRTILDTGGAEKLLGRGDMLFQGNGSSRPIRVQGTYVEDEIDAIVDFVKQQQEANYLFQSESLLERAEQLEEKDELLDEVLPFIVDQGTVSASSLQRKFRIGFNRASNLIDMLESKNLISENKGSRPRDVFLTRSDYEEKFL